MSFLREVVRDKPVGLFMMDDSSPFQDYSGYNLIATVSTGTPGSHTALVSGASFAQIFKNTQTAAFASPVFIQGQESSSFTLECWARTVQATATIIEQQVIGRPAKMDGITLKGTVVSFVTNYNTAPEARASYDLQVQQAFHAVGIHTSNKNSLYINGELVAEVILTEAQQADAFNTAAGTGLSSGASTGVQEIALNGVCLYSYALSKDTIARHYMIGSDLPDFGDVASSFGGDCLELNVNSQNTFLQQSWSTKEEWESGTALSVTVSQDRLKPNFDGTTSLPGQWLDSFPLSSSLNPTVYGVTINWQGEGAVVEASLNGTTWETAVRGSNIALVTQGFNTTDKELQVRVSFPGGIVNDTSYIDNLTVTGLKSAALSQYGRTITLNKAVQQEYHSPLAFSDNNGVEIKATGTIVISADTSGEAKPLRTLEIWVKRNTTTAVTYSMSGTSYQNGAIAGTSTTTQGRWTLLHIVATADNLSTFTITNAGQIGAITLYDTALSAATIADIYATYTGRKVLVSRDISQVRLVSSANPVKMYTHDWSITSAG